MTNDEIDRILAERDDIVPSSGFVPAVMDAVMRESSAPPPIPFPWKTSLVGLAASLLALTLFPMAAPPIPAPIASLFTGIVATANLLGAGWVALALVVSFVSVELSMRLAS